MQRAGRRDDEIAELFAAPSVTSVRRPDGSFLVKSTVPLAASHRSIGVWIERWANEQPDRVFLAERFDTKGDWATITYGEMRRRVRAAASWMIARVSTPSGRW